jgi:hypothetical protein
MKAVGGASKPLSPTYQQAPSQFCLVLIQKGLCSYSVKHFEMRCSKMSHSAYPPCIIQGALHGVRDHIAQFAHLKSPALA